MSAYHDDLAKKLRAAGVPDDFFDEAVHEAKASEAATINNAGMSAQTDYLGIETVIEMLQAAGVKLPGTVLE